MGDYINVFERIKDSWLEWKSLVYAVILLGAAGWGLISIDGFITGTLERVYLILALLALFVVYIFCCALHVESEKQKAGAEGSLTSPTGKRKAKRRLFYLGIVIFSLAVVFFTCLLVSGIVSKDGKYVIWADEYHVALTHEVHKNFYLSGEEVSAKGKTLEDYPRSCVFELDFQDSETFTMSYGGRLLGVTPGQNGVGFSEACTSILWKLEQVQDGVYYIVNVEENTYLKWYDHMQNWTTHPNITDDNEGQYLMCLERIE